MTEAKQCSKRQTTWCDFFTLAFTPSSVCSIPTHCSFGIMRTDFFLFYRHELPPDHSKFLDHSRRHVPLNDLTPCAHVLEDTGRQLSKHSAGVVLGPIAYRTNRLTDGHCAMIHGLLPQAFPISALYIFLSRAFVLPARSNVPTSFVCAYNEPSRFRICKRK